MTEAIIATIPLRIAYLCLDCDEINANGSLCAKCGSVQLHPLATWLNRKPKGKKRG